MNKSNMFKKTLIILLISLFALPGVAFGAVKKPVTIVKKSAVVKKVVAPPPAPPEPVVVVVASKKPTVSGSVLSVDGSTVAVLDSKTKTTVQVDSTSADFGPVLEFSDITAGDKVIVVGKKSENDDTFVAEKISDISKPLTLVRLGGKVVSVDAGSFKFKTKTFGNVMVRFNDSTAIKKDSYLVSGTEIAVGDYIKVSGRWNVIDRPALRKIDANNVDIFTELNKTKITGKIVANESKEKYHTFFITVETEDGSQYTVDMSDAATKNKTAKGKKYYIKEQLSVGDSVEISGQATSDSSVILADLVVNLMNNINNK